MKHAAISIVVFLIYFLLIATSFCYGASLHLELNAYNSQEYLELNGGVLPWSNYAGDTFIMPDYTPSPIGYYNNPEVFVTYEFPLGFYAQTASISLTTFNAYAAFEWLHVYMLLDVSPNGITWNNVPTNEIVDISEYVHDATSIHIRGRLWSEYGPVAAKWMYTPAGGAQGLILDVQGFDYPAPEPSTMHLLIMGGICLAILAYKRATRGF